jgi:hypothetical protein
MIWLRVSEAEYLVIKLKSQAHTQAAFIQNSAHYTYFHTTEPNLD